MYWGKHVGMDVIRVENGWQCSVILRHTKTTQQHKTQVQRTENERRIRWREGSLQIDSKMCDSQCRSWAVVYIQIARPHSLRLELFEHIVEQNLMHGHIHLENYVTRLEEIRWYVHSCVKWSMRNSPLLWRVCQPCGRHHHRQTDVLHLAPQHTNLEPSIGIQQSTRASVAVIRTLCGVRLGNTSCRGALNRST